MKHTYIDKAALKAKSEELEIPFSNLLAGCILEELMYLITDSPFGEFLWIKNSYIFGAGQYRKKNILTLEFAYLLDEKVIAKGKPLPGQQLSLKMGYIILSYILKKEKVPEIKWRGRASYTDEIVELEVTGELEEMTVPLQIRISPIYEEELLPIRKKLQPVMENGQEIEYLQYPWEKMLAELLYTILNDMELIPEMRYYDQVYQILGNELVDGRHIRGELAEHCEKGQMAPDEERLKEILSYKNYNYMRKKWEKYLRHRKRDEPSWDEVMDRIEVFLTGIWKAICRDEVFFGDWMPGLGRFLD